MSDVLSQRAQDGILPAKQARSLRRQRAILDATHRLLESIGYEHLRVEQIASESDSSVGVIYQRFRNKDGLLDALLDETLDRLEVLIDSELTTEDLTGSRTEIIGRLVGIVVAFMRDNQGFVRAITSRQLRDPDGVTPLQETARRAVANTWAALVRDHPELDNPATQTRFGFAVQMTIGTATNAILNRPGPLLIDDDLLVQALTASIDSLMRDPNLPL